MEISKQLTNSKYTIAVMSGNFVQRGDTSLIDKWTKTEMAINSGIDLVIELPTLYATSSAENFADGAIKILNSLGIVDYLSFGSELGELNPLNDIANVLYKEPKEFSSLINNELKAGISYPKAREIALSKYFGNTKKLSSILNSSNNILGVEYLKALKKHRSKIIPLTIKREDSEYNSNSIKNGIASATAIRTMLKENKNVHYVVPYETYKLLEKSIYEGNIVTDLSVFEKEIIYTLRKMSSKEIYSLPDVSEGLENKIKSSVNMYNSLEELIKNIKSKRFTQTRIQRILLYALLNITQKDINSSKKVMPYIRVLGFNNNGKKIISSIAKNNPKLHIIISVKKFMDFSNDTTLKNMLYKDIFSTDVYSLGLKTNPIANLDYTHKVIEI